MVELLSAICTCVGSHENAIATPGIGRPVMASVTRRRPRAALTERRVGASGADERGSREGSANSTPSVS